MTGPGEITGLLEAAARGDRASEERLWTLVYDRLREIAGRELHRRGSGETLSTTGLVHEAYFKLADRPGIGWHNRSHFYALACRAMRQVLVDHARRRRAEKRGGGDRLVTLDRAAPASAQRTTDLVELDDALNRLAAINERLARVVECRFFGGLSLPEVADTLGIPLRTAEREWQRARAYLYRMLGPTEDRAAG
jgi:RNA polymerase sigma factor (TIGR02999 family)